MKWMIGFSLILMSPSLWAQPHLSRQWSRSTLSEPHYQFRPLHRMSPLLTDEMVIQGNGVDGIRAFLRRSGRQQWSLNLFNGVEAGASLDGNRLYFGSNNGIFYCVDVNTGQILWKQNLHTEALARPLIHGGFVYHVAGNNNLYAFNKNSGEILWVQPNSAKSNMTIRGQTPPVFEKGILYLGFSDGTFAAINAQNGRRLWSKRIGDDKKFNDVDARAVLTDQCILVSSYANALYCLSKDNGEIRWRHDFGGYNAVLVSENQIYYPTVDGELHLLDAQSGKLLRKIINIPGMASEVTEMGPYIIYSESQGELVIRKKDSLEKVASFAPGLGSHARPTVDSKKKQIYLMSNAANLYRLDFKTEPENPFLWSKESYAK